MQLQDAVPMTLGQEFHGYATNIGEEVLRLENAADLLLEVNLGATAIGTGLNTPTAALRSPAASSARSPATPSSRHRT